MQATCSCVSPETQTNLRDNLRLILYSTTRALITWKRRTRPAKVLSPHFHLPKLFVLLTVDIFLFILASILIGVPTPLQRVWDTGIAFLWFLQALFIVRIELSLKKQRRINSKWLFCERSVLKRNKFRKWVPLTTSKKVKHPYRPHKKDGEGNIFSLCVSSYPISTPLPRQD